MALGGKGGGAVMVSGGEPLPNEGDGQVVDQSHRRHAPNRSEGGGEGGGNLLAAKPSNGFNKWTIFPWDTK